MEISDLAESIIRYLFISSSLLLILGLLCFLWVQALKIQGKAKLLVCALIIILPLVYPLKTLFPESIKISVNLDLDYFNQDIGSGTEKYDYSNGSFLSDTTKAIDKADSNEVLLIDSMGSDAVIKDGFMKTIHGLVREWRLVAAIVWGCIFIFFLIRLIRTGCRINRFLRLAVSADDPEVLELLYNCVKDTGLGTIPRLFISEGISTPMVMGFFRPGIVIPHHLLNNEYRNGLRFTLLHELKHLHRHHNWWLLIESVIGAAYFFHPVFHWAKRKIHEELEFICDSHVALVTDDSVSYADFLLNQIWQHGPVRNPALTLPFVSVASKTAARIHFILRNTSPKPFMNLRDRLSVLTVLMVFPLILILSLMPSAQDADYEISNPLKIITIQENEILINDEPEEENELSYVENTAINNFSETDSHANNARALFRTSDSIESSSISIPEKPSFEAARENNGLTGIHHDEGLDSEILQEKLLPAMHNLNVSGSVYENNELLTQRLSDPVDVTGELISSTTIAEKYLGSPVNELSISRIIDIKALDEYTVIFIMRGGDLYITRLPDPCPGLLYASDYNLISNNGRISRFDQIQALSHNHVTGTAVMLGAFYPYRYDGNKHEAIKALKKGLLTELLTEGAFKEFNAGEKRITVAVHHDNLRL